MVNLQLLSEEQKKLILIMQTQRIYPFKHMLYLMRELFLRQLWIYVILLIIIQGHGLGLSVKIAIVFKIQW